jgi:hypothetical protein
MATQVEQQKYNFLLAKLKENQQIINALITNPQGVDLNEVKDNAQDLETQLQQQGYSSTNDIQRNVKQTQQQAQQLVKNQNRQPSDLDALKVSRRELLGVAKSMTLFMSMSWLASSLGTALKNVKDFIFGSNAGGTSFIQDIGGMLQNHGTTIGVAALLFTFGYFIFKIYKKIVNKAKESAQKKVQPTREEVITFMEEIQRDSTLLNEGKLLTEIKMSVDKQKDYLDMALNVCQDALDVIAMTTIGGGLFYIALTAALAPVMFAAALGSFLWVILFLTRNALRNKQKEIG